MWPDRKNEIQAIQEHCGPETEKCTTLLEIFWCYILSWDNIGKDILAVWLFGC